MVNINNIFDRVQDLSRKDKSGYMSSEEFNRDFSQAQDILYEYYYEQYERSQEIVDSLNPFHVEVELLIENGYCELPIDYRHRTEVGYLKIKNPDICGPGEPSISPYPVPYINANEERETLASAIRKPSVVKNRYYHTFINNKLRILPTDISGYIVLKYLKVPPPALYAVTLDVVNDEENYDPLNSINPIWNNQDAHHLVDLMLLFKGIEVRENALIEWVRLKQQYTNTGN